ncbi:MAG: branched-chain amino acid ABC transporter permease, partial [Firmicutes bacterium]|nr:branched-chain amino acid ABC transporter permease [Bacillota bacterium]
MGAFFIEQVIQGICLGSLYSLVAVGLVMIYQAVSVFNFAHADLVALGGIAAFVAYRSGVTAFVLTGLCAFAACFVTGMLVERVAFRPLLRAPGQNYLIATIGIGIVLRNLMRIIFSADVFAFPSVFGSDPLIVGSVLIVPDNIAILLVTTIAVVALHLFFKKTLLGKSMRAVAQDREAAQVMGINVNRSISWTYGLSAGLAGLAGLLVAPIFYVSAEMGGPLRMKAFIAFILAG